MTFYSSKLVLIFLGLIFCVDIQAANPIYCHKVFSVKEQLTQTMALPADELLTRKLRTFRLDRLTGEPQTPEQLMDRVYMDLQFGHFPDFGSAKVAVTTWGQALQKSGRAQLLQLDVSVHEQYNYFVFENISFLIILKNMDGQSLHEGRKGVQIFVGKEQETATESIGILAGSKEKNGIYFSDMVKIYDESFSRARVSLNELERILFSPERDQLPRDFKIAPIVRRAMGYLAKAPIDLGQMEKVKLWNRLVTHIRRIFPLFSSIELIGDNGSIAHMGTATLDTLVFKVDGVILRGRMKTSGAQLDAKGMWVEDLEAFYPIEETFQ